MYRWYPPTEAEGSGNAGVTGGSGDSGNLGESKVMQRVQGGVQDGRPGKEDADEEDNGGFGEVEKGVGRRGKGGRG